MPNEYGRLTRIALVIANANYQFAQSLNNTHRDAEAVAGALSVLGFTSHTLDENQHGQPLRPYLDLSLTEMNRLLGKFNVAAQSADFAIIYYSGHGIEIDFKNYLIPVEADLKDAVSVRYEAVSLPSVIEAVAGASKLRLVILDACRDNPFARTMKGLKTTKSLAAGLAPPGDAGASLVFYAAAEGQTAVEGDGGGLSPFAQALSTTLREPGRELFSLFGKITAQVRRATGGNQQPKVYGSPPDDSIILNPARTATDDKTIVAPPTAPQITFVDVPEPPRHIPAAPTRPPASGGLKWILGAFATVAVVISGYLIFWFLDPVPIENYRVMVRYSGIDVGDIRELKGKLSGLGWKIIQPEGSENNQSARGRNDIRYSGGERAAARLAQQVTEQDIASERVVARLVPGTPANMFEIWISRPEPAAVTPPISPPTPLTPTGPARPRINTDSASWSVRPPDQAYCMQRKNSDAAPSMYLVRCFQTEDACNSVQRTDSGDRTACVASSGLLASPLWAQAGSGGIQNSWFKYSYQPFSTPFPQFGEPELEPARYKVSIWFAGTFDRERDIVPLSQKLRALGWDSQVPRPSGGSDRTPKANGAREVRYSGFENQRAAEVLVESINKLGVVTGPVKAVASTGIEGNELQLWISR